MRQLLRKATLILPPPTERRKKEKKRKKYQIRNADLLVVSCADYRAGPRSGCTCLAALRCVITTRSHILRVRPLLFPRVDLSFPPPINKRERPVPQEGSTRGRGESCHSIRPPPSACCCCCFTKPIKGGPIPIGRQASYDSTIFVFYTAHTHTAPVLVAGFFRQTPFCIRF